MKLAIMQPYFFPYIGYFQLIRAADKFVIYDNIKFTKKGWFHRNKLSFNKKVEYFTINIKNDSDYLDAKDRVISPIYFEKEVPKILRKIEQSYKKAPYFNEVFPWLKNVFQYEEENLFNYIHNSIKETVKYLNINTEIIISSSLPINYNLKNKWKIFDIYNYLQADLYINPIGGKKIYDIDDFKKHKVNLKFLESNMPKYKQFNEEFIPYLSIIDVMMFNSPEEIRKMLNNYELI